MKKYIGLLAVVFVFAVLFFLFAISLNNRFEFGLSDDSIAVAVIGIIATFIVISNYAQVKDIENKFEKAIKDIKTEFGDKIKEVERLSLK